MSVQVTFLGRLGNNLFQYALGRIIATHHGFALDCQHLDGSYPPDSPTILGRLADHFCHAPLALAGTRHESPIQAIGGDGNGWHEKRVDLADVLADRSPRRVRLRGFFQRFEYYSGHTDQIRRWFHIGEKKSDIVPGKYDVLVHFRRDAEYGLLGWALPLSYYGRILRSLPRIEQVYVCGTGVDDQVRAFLSGYNPIYCHGSAMEDFAFFRKFRRIVVSNSTFAWWAAFLSEATELYCPKTVAGRAYGFTGWEDVDLHTREHRYVEVDNFESARFVPIVTNLMHNSTINLRDGRMIIEFNDTKRIIIRTSADNVEVVKWVARQARPFSPKDIPRTVTVVGAGNLIQQLQQGGCISISGNYTE